MTYILSAQRDEASPEALSQNWKKYLSYLDENKSILPAGVFSIARSEWWYGFNDPRSPHDSRLNSFVMKDVLVSDERAPHYTSIELELGTGFGATIQLRYPKVFHYRFECRFDMSGNHGGWRYDEFSCSEEPGRFVHTIEWGDGAVWVIEASDLIHGYEP